MQTISSNTRQLVSVILLVTLAAFSLSAWAQLETDVATGIPQLAMVENVDREAGTVTLNGDVYRVELASRPGPAAISPNGRSLKLSDLEPGMEILISTDGTEPSQSNMPQVLGMWKPR